MFFIRKILMIFGSLLFAEMLLIFQCNATWHKWIQAAAHGDC